MDVSGDISRSRIPAFRLIEDQLNQAKELLNKQLTVSARLSDISQLLDHINSRSAKMIRPGLVLLSYRAVRDDFDELGRVASSEKKPQDTIRNTQYEAIRIAAIVEMIHNATLLHDDVIDEGQQRRGLPSINSLCGNESAVLLGDFLLSQVFKMCTELELKVTNVIADAAARTCEGELRQVILRRNWQMRESEYIDIITEKTAAFFSSCCRLGALLAKATKTQVQALGRFGLDAGVAFQITDDLLDLTGDESQTGKTVGSDVNTYKPTLPVIHLLRVVERREKTAIINQLNHTAGIRKKALLKMLRSHGSLEYTRERAQEFVDRAVRALAGIKKSSAKEALVETATFMANRAI